MLFITLILLLIGMVVLALAACSAVAMLPMSLSELPNPSLLRRRKAPVPAEILLPVAENPAACEIQIQ